jgi:aminopeptidase N
VTRLEAEGIKQDFIVAMRFADAFGKTKREALKETAAKYDAERLAAARLALERRMEKDMRANADLFALALAAKKGGA